MMATITSQFEAVSLRREHLREQIADLIQRMIASDQLQPGSRLPTERDLATMLHVNRATVREAIRLLEERGLVQMKVGSGTFVTGCSPEVVTDSIERYFVLGSSSHAGLMTFREMLEPEMAAVAAKQALPADIIALQDLVEEIEAASAQDDIPRQTIADTAFHETLAACTHNELAIAVMTGIRRILATWMRTQMETLQLHEGALGHRAIYEAIVQKDPDRAREAMRAHLRVARRTLQD